MFVWLYGCVSVCLCVYEEGSIVTSHMYIHGTELRPPSFNRFVTRTRKYWWLHETKGVTNTATPPSSALSGNSLGKAHEPQVESPGAPYFVCRNKACICAGMGTLYMQKDSCTFHTWEIDESLCYCDSTGVPHVYTTYQ